MTRVLFVCLGNICRSPAAEAVMTHLIAENSLSDVIECDSAGTSAYHHGEPADSRMISHGRKRNYNLTSISRPFDPASDFENFDWIITMDDCNFENVIALARKSADQDKVKKMLSFSQSFSDTEVPDPYYGGEAGFEHVYDLLEDCCQGLLDQISKVK